MGTCVFRGLSLLLALALFTGCKAVENWVTQDGVKYLPDHITLTGPSSVQANACSAVFTVVSLDAGGAANSVTRDTPVALSSSSSSGQFFSDAACTSAITSSVLPNKGLTFSFYYKDTVAGSPTLTASPAQDLSGATLSLRVGPDRLSLTGPSSLGMNSCSTAFTINAKDTNGTSANVLAAVTISLTDDKSTGDFYSDSSCTTAISSVNLTESSASFYYKTTTAENFILTATDSAGLLASTTLSVTVPIPPAGLSYSKSSATYYTNAAIANNSPSFSSGAADSYTITPDLPSGLAMDSSTGVISGTPTVTSSLSTHTITATNMSGTTSATVAIKVKTGTPQGLLVKDIRASTYSTTNTYTGQSFFISMGGSVYFNVTDLAHGIELWKTDGTVSGTRLVKDIGPGSSGFPYYAAASSNTLFFSAGDSTLRGTELWKSDGTTAGTALVKDIYPGAGNGYSTGGIVIGSTFYFMATDGTTGQELWKSDGTTAGTVLVKDLASGSANSNPSFFTEFNNKLVFTANSTELWITDGTENGTTMLKNTITVTSSAKICAGSLFLAMSDGSTGMELWKTDGTSGGTVLVKDINSGAGSSSPAPAVCWNNLLYFSANDGSTGIELWKSDGTSGGTALVKDIYTGGPSSALSGITLFNGALYFSANDGINGYELWKSDGTSGGTVLLKDIRSGSSSSSPATLTVAGSTLYFSANDGTNGIELWKSDGTESGTVLVKDILPGSSSSPTNFSALNNLLIFNADAGTSREAWVSDGTSAGTVSLRSNVLPYDSTPSLLLTDGDTLYFTADDGSTGAELWKSDGTETGTALVKDIRPGTTTSLVNMMGKVGNTVVFKANDGTVGAELWTTDGTAGGTNLVKDMNPGATGGFPLFGSGPFTKITDTFMSLIVSDGTSGWELWGTDGTTAGTSLIKDTNPGASAGMSSTSSKPVFVNSGLMFFYATDGGAAGWELWKTDGTTAGTNMVKEICVGTGLCAYGNLAWNSKLYFQADDGVSGYEIWVSDGTAAGTTMVKDIYPGAASSSLQAFFAGSSHLFFSANDGTYGIEPWVTDGTTAGTRMLKDLISGANSSTVSWLFEYKGLVYFSFTNSDAGTQQFWQTDGTETGTVQVPWYTTADVGAEPGFAPTSGIVVNEIMFFVAPHNERGLELWRSDATATGTWALDLNPGPNSSNPTSLKEADGVLYLQGFKDGVGKELWRVTPF